jgi:tetratricopeptide (TPR) repeat protein
VFRNKRLNIILPFLSFLLFSGCSLTTKLTKISEDDLTSYNPNSPKQFEAPIVEVVVEDIDRVESENDLVIQAIWYEMNGYYQKSNFFYGMLYDKVGGEEYLLRELTTALYAGIMSPNVPRLEELVAKNPTNIQLKRLLISFYINEKRNEKAKKIGKELVALAGEPIDYELSAGPYILSADYSKAVELLMVAYSKTYNEDILVKVAVLLEKYMNNIKDAIYILERHRVHHHCSEKLCLQLVDFYSKEENVPALIELYQDLYKKTGENIYAIKIVESYIHLKEFDKAIAFLQKDYNDDELLYEVFLAKQDYSNALIVAERLYSKEKTPRWLAESAMALYEKSENKHDKEMLNTIVNRFERAISEGIKDSVYLNYYGYTLIDKNIDIEKGVNIVKDALKEEPDNSYFLDSLAWGYYKLHECKRAYKAMKRVVDLEGLEDDDITAHWNAIQNCNK